MSDVEIWSGIVVLAILIIVLPLMWLGWRGRKRRQSSLGPVAQIPANVGDPTLTTEILYVATTAASDPLDRLTLPGLTYRGRGRLVVWSSGLALSIDGERDVFISADRVTAVGTSTWTIDRAVEQGGLLRVDWQSDSSKGRVGVETYFRVLDAADKNRALEALQSFGTGAHADTTSHPAPGAHDEGGTQ